MLISKVHDRFMTSLSDLKPLFIGHLTLLAATFLLGPGNLADVRVQSVWTAFLLLGWLAAPTWAGEHVSPMHRYLAAMVGSVAFHGLLAFAGSVIGFGFQTYLAVWSAGIFVVGFWRLRRRVKPPPGHRRILQRNALICLALAVFVVCVYRTPRSNDIHQFLLQQQDMLENGSLRVTSIGVSAMNVDQPMPRWKASYWHSLPCVIAYASGIAVDQVLLRYATLPVAFSVLLCLIEIMRSIAGKRSTYAIVLLAILGPVLLWYRNFNAFNYSFRITNNFLLDKDFVSFFLIPATIWLAKEWISGKRRYAVILLGLLPALIRFHPLTAVYLLLLAPAVAALSFRNDRSTIRRTFVAFAAASLLFVSVIVIGDAQSNHEHIRQIIQLDYAQSLEGRPRHYWIGFYNVIPDSPLISDTIEWIQGRCHLKINLISGCGLLLSMHFGLMVIAIAAAILKTFAGSRRVFAAGLISAATLWGLWWVSASFLTRFPHYAAGYERLHWFAYPIAIPVVAVALTTLIPHTSRRIIANVALAFIVVSSLFFRFELPTPLTHVRGVNSLLDAEIAAAGVRRDRWAQIAASRTLLDMRPTYLKPSDRVLLLDTETTKHYWLIRQGVFWPDPYVEAFVWFHRGDEFLIDRQFFYELLDHHYEADPTDWFENKRISLIVDRRDNADVHIRELSQRHGISVKRVESGVWRLGPVSPEN